MENIIDREALKTKEWLSATELHVYLDCSREFIEKHIATRRLPGLVRFGNRWRFRKSDIERALNRGELLLPKAA